MRLQQLLLGFSFALLTAVPSSAQWQRTVFSGKGEFHDTPTPHSLSYFTADPFLRDDGGDFCETCAPPDRDKYVITSEVHQVGVLSGFPVIEILYTVRQRGDSPPLRPNWKLILVKTGSDSYEEIYHLQAMYTTAALSAASTAILTVGDEQVLSTDDPDGGNGGGCWEEYWWFDSSGPHQLDFSAVESAIEKRVPPSSWFMTGCWALYLGQEEIRSFVQKKDARCRACDMLGSVTAHFHLRGAIAEPDEITFTDNPSGPN